MKPESDELTLGLLKDILLMEIANISTKLKAIKVEFKREDTRLSQIKNKLNLQDKLMVQLQIDFKDIQEGVVLNKKRG